MDLFVVFYLYIGINFNFPFIYHVFLRWRYTSKFFLFSFFFLFDHILSFVFPLSRKKKNLFQISFIRWGINKNIFYRKLHSLHWIEFMYTTMLIYLLSTLCKTNDKGICRFKLTSKNITVLGSSRRIRYSHNLLLRINWNLNKNWVVTQSFKAPFIARLLRIIEIFSKSTQKKLHSHCRYERRNVTLLFVYSLQFIQL